LASSALRCDIDCKYTVPQGRSAIFEVVPPRGSVRNTSRHQVDSFRRNSFHSASTSIFLETIWPGSLFSRLELRFGSRSRCFRTTYCSCMQRLTGSQSCMIYIQSHLSCLTEQGSNSIGWSASEVKDCSSFQIPTAQIIIALYPVSELRLNLYIRKPYSYGHITAGKERS